jgi:hypothetical protein
MSEAVDGFEAINQGNALKPILVNNL